MYVSEGTFCIHWAITHSIESDQLFTDTNDHNLLWGIGEEVYEISNHIL